MNLSEILNRNCSPSWRVISLLILSVHYNGPYLRTYVYKSKNIFIKMLNNVGMAVPKSYKKGAVHMQQGSG